MSYETSILSGWYQQFDGIKSAMKGRSSIEERTTDPTMLVVYLNSASETQLKRLFELMDKDGNGALEAADFAIMAKNPNTSQFWEELKANFDADGDESVSFEEFKLRIMDTVRTRIEVGSIPSANWTWRQVMARLGEWCNWMVQEQCREIFSYLAYGEYGSEGDDVDDSESFGCGSHLGAPAFPGGEPPSAKHIAYAEGLSADFQSASLASPSVGAFSSAVRQAPTVAPAPLYQQANAAPAPVQPQPPMPTYSRPPMAMQAPAGITIHVHGPVHIHMTH